ncbi:30S ribosomal protein S5 [Candidatus Falkowbacteria bacterium HGW-Falkowbacteria-1]|jgi:small subunit ribosomal protein S5|uniref:Small ribosomal subunit protein uS5 n=1 Tax=Candidatus Falkowbacteria bacterium HGW-Falkowbacteria-1 TaxID=2013768 RepID=A0A2N2E969_9BACT|nr:MAG: 30S ribosomal protein S5 [Candidatus Falkowbacteria bacterium HGW-Falkowbacteria-1]
MSEEKKQTNTQAVGNNLKQTSAQVVGSNLNSNPNNNFNKKKDFGGKGRRFSERPKEEFDQRILDVARVTRVMKGGKRMSFRVCIAIGDKKGRVAVALGKGADVTLAVNKAVNKAKKNIIEVPIYNDTIPHQINGKFGSAKIILKPVAKGRGVIAGGVVRVILDLAGVKNISSKILGTNNKVNNAKCTVMALSKLKRRENNNKADRFENKNGKENNEKDSTLKK